MINQETDNKMRHTSTFENVYSHGNKTVSKESKIFIARFHSKVSSFSLN